MENHRLWTRKSLLLWSVLFLPFLVLPFCWPLLSPLAQSGLSLAAVIWAFFAISWLLALTRKQTTSSQKRPSAAPLVAPGEKIPSIPRTLQEVRALSL